MPNQFLPFLISRKTALIGILNMMFIAGQCVPFSLGPSFNDDFDHKAPSMTSEDSLHNYPVKRLSIQKNKSPTDDDKYLSFTKREISGLSTDSSFKSESPEPESLFLRIRKPDDEESANNEETPKPESGVNEEEPKPESGVNEEEPKPESGENEETPKPESGENEEEPKTESGENEEEPKPESGENEEEPKPESGENEESSAHEQNEERPASVPDEEEEGERQPEESISLSTSNLEESPVLHASDQEDMSFSKNEDTSEEDFAFQKKPFSSDFLKQKGKSPIRNKQKGKVQGSATANGVDSGPSEFLPEENWDEDSFYPPSFPSVWKGKKSRTIKPLQPMVSWNEFLVMQDKFQKDKLSPNPKPLKNNKLSSSFHKSKDNLYSFVEDAIKRNKQIEKELMDLKRMLQKSTSEQKSSSQLNGLSRIVNNTLQLNVPLLQEGRIKPQEFKIKIEAEAPLKIKTHVGDGNENAIRINDKPLRLGERSSKDLNANKIQVREIPTSTKMADMLTVSTEHVRDSSSTPTASTTEIRTEAEDNDPLKAERIAFIRKGAQFLRQAWYKYKQKRYPFLNDN